MYSIWYKYRLQISSQLYLKVLRDKINFSELEIVVPSALYLVFLLYFLYINIDLNINLYKYYNAIEWQKRETSASTSRNRQICRYWAIFMNPKLRINIYRCSSFAPFSGHLTFLSIQVNSIVYQCIMRTTCALIYFRRQNPNFSR